MAKINEDSTLPKLEYIKPRQQQLPINIEEKKAGYIVPDQTNQQSELDTVKLENNFYDEINQNKMKTWDKFTKLAKYNPFVPLGCLVTMGVLLNGVIAMKNKDRAKSQKMMRYRVAAQGSTIIALVIGTIASQYFISRSD